MSILWKFKTAIFQFIPYFTKFLILVIEIVNNGNIVPDGSNERRYIKQKLISYDINCNIYNANMIYKQKR